MSPLKSLRVAARDDLFDTLFKQSTCMADFQGNESAEEQFVEHNRILSRQIESIGIELLGADAAEKNYYDDLNIWPNCTRYISASFDGFTQDYYDRIRALLIGEFAEWRIQVVVYANIVEGRTMFGSMAIWRDKILLDRALYAALVWRGFDFRFNGEIEWIQSL